MCTTYLAYKIADAVKKDVKFLDYPRLVRLNPNIPWKTRGNGAVSMTIGTKNPQPIKDRIIRMVEQYSDVRNGANPGLVFYEGYNVPRDLAVFSESALWQLIGRATAKKFAARHGLDTFHLGNGQGLVGAISAIGYRFVDSTVELLSYRRKSMFGKKRVISLPSVQKMQVNHPQTFNSYDTKRRRILIAPHGPDPVFYGLRGESPTSVLRASKEIVFDERLAGHMIFRSNQGTGDHLKNGIDIRMMRPYDSGVVEGMVSKPPTMHAGGHVTLSLRSGGTDVSCMVYRPTGLSMVAMELIPGDKVRIGGGVRKSTSRHPRTINVELIVVLQTSIQNTVSNPSCKKCGKNMKSKGKSQGFFCIRCNTRADKKIIKKIRRSLRVGQYIPAVSAHRHLTRPLQRQGKTNKVVFDGSIPWFAEY